MNNELKYFLRTLELRYNEFRYSSYYPIAFPSLIVFITLVLFGLFVLPHLQNWFSIQNEIKETQERINIMRDNSRILENMNHVSADEEYEIATQALPHTRDFLGILQAINQSALRGGVLIDDYSFSLGDVSENNPSVKLITPVTVKFSIQGNFNAIKSFIREMEQKLPVTRLDNIDYSSGKAGMLVTFYMKEFPDIRIIDSVPVTQLTQSDKNLLSKLREWASSSQ